jgi:uncharacterized protein with GYD domain
VEEIVAVMRQTPDNRHGYRVRAMIVVLWRAGLRVQEALELLETDLDEHRGSLLVRHGKGRRRREIGMDAWGWEQLRPWLAARAELPIGPLFCVIDGATRGRAWSSSDVRFLDVPLRHQLLRRPTTASVEGVRTKGGSSRRDRVAEAAKSLGGQLEAFYFAFGDHDVVVLLDLPDNQAAAAIALSVDAAGGATTKTTVLLTPEEVDDAAKRSRDAVDYRPPGT